HFPERCNARISFVLVLRIRTDKDVEPVVNDLRALRVPFRVSEVNGSDVGGHFGNTWEPQLVLASASLLDLFRRGDGINPERTQPGIEHRPYQRECRSVKLGVFEQPNGAVMLQSDEDIPDHYESLGISVVVIVASE